MTKFFKTKKRTYFGVIFVQREFFLKAVTKYNCSRPPAFKCQTYRVDWPSKQILFHHYQHAKIIQINLLNPSTHVLDTSDLGVS